MKRVAKLFAAALSAAWALGVAGAIGSARAGVEIYVTDFMAPQTLEIGPFGGAPTTTARLFAAPGEYEPVSFAVRPDERLAGMLIAPADLVAADGAARIPAANVRVQSVEGFHGGPHDILMDVGQPWDSPAYQKALFWATVHVPAGAIPGLYRGKIAVTAEGKPAAALDLELEVLPIALPEPPYALGFNYSSPKDTVALAAHLRDMREHGMTVVAPLYNFKLPINDDDTREIGEFIEAYRAAGFTQPLYLGAPMQLCTMLAGYGPIDSARFQRKYLAAMKTVWAETRRHPVPVIVSIGDEFTNKALPGVEFGEKLARLTFEELPEICATSDMNGYAEVMRMAPYLSIATFNNGWDGADHHNGGRRLLNAGFLREVQEKTGAIPWFVNTGEGRMPFGFFFWKMAKCGARGKVEWYYNLGRNDKGSVVRVEGAQVWPTLAYERSREGIDDIRYALALERAIEAAPKRGRPLDEAAQGAALLKALDDSIVADWTAYTEGGERFPSTALLARLNAGLVARWGAAGAVRRALADAIVALQNAGVNTAAAR